MSVRLITWNVNSLRQRLDHLARITEEQSPQVVCLQETKVQNDDFPYDAIKSMGYEHLSVHGQKSYNGVAILSRLPFEAEDRRVWCKKDDCRHISVTVDGGLEIHNFYVPSGGNVPDPEQNDKFAHKLQFLTEMAKWAKKDSLAKRRAILVGDMNVAPFEQDVWNHKRLLKSVGHTPIESEHMLRLHKAGSFIDVGRHFVPLPEPLYTWWGYRFKEAFARDYGWRLDHALATPPLEDSISSMTVLRDSRSWEKPSDHVPIMVDID
ncbi:exodeoxyribonuclease III [Pelagibius sp. Alg239-R121]|uniref:exodeoxyribonuclease III n=1 Tax=Pelagibius sp. Alg239-R121 TaxID=2993448 RepID=UPI0024A62614|nr:exodeoxyribonuclease III [Pelagibius sp. Alg239-R121]